jgi:hypothetical protein
MKHHSHTSAEPRKPIEQLMNDKERQKSGLTKLSAEELANLNEWLDENTVLAPGDPPK